MIIKRGSMKKIVLLLLFLSSILKADYLITNGEIALFYDGKNNILKNVKDREFKKEVLSNFQILLIKDYKIYRARNYYTEVKYIDGKNIFYMKSNVNGDILETYIILSNNQKNNMYIYTNLSKLGWKKPYNLVYKFSPLVLEGNIENKENYYKYDMLNFSKDSNSEILVGTENDFENFKVKFLENILTKQPDERIYLVKKIDQNKKDDFLEISLSKEKPEFTNLTFEDIKNKEIEFWKKFDNKYYYLRQNMINQIRNFYLIFSSKYTQSSLKANMSRVKYAEQLKVMYLNGILNKKSLIPDFKFERNDGIQNIYTYYYYIKFCINKKINPNKNEKIKNNVTIIRNNIEEAYKSIQNKEGDWLQDSLIFYNFLLEIEKMSLSKELFINIESIKNEIKNNVKKEILDKNENLKNYDNIEYLQILTLKDKRQNLERLVNHLNNRIGLLQENGEINRIANLKLALLLYENGYTVESDKVFYNIDYFINFEENYNELNIEEIYLYLMNIQYRGLI